MKESFDKEDLKEKLIRTHIKNALLLDDKDFIEISQIIEYSAKQETKSCKINQSKIKDETYFNEALRCLRKESETFEYQDFILFLSNEIERYKFTKQRALDFIRELENSGVNLNLHGYKNLNSKRIQTYLISKISLYLKNSNNKEVALSTINSVLVNLTESE